jgi:hypothetical protein
MTSKHQGFKNWQDLLKRHPDFAQAGEDEVAVSRALARLGRESNGCESCWLRVASISRGWALLTAAEIASPPSPKICDIRDAQWRLVMAYAGLEIAAKAIIGGGGPVKLAERLQPETRFAEIPAPTPQRGSTPMSTEDQFASPGEGWKAEMIWKFLGVGGRDREVLQAWFSNGERITGRKEAIRLLKALRNATAHGALSPTKCRQLRLYKAWPALIGVAVDLLNQALLVLAATGEA